MSDLVIVESPTKARTIERFLGAGYTVMATVGHVRDLPKKKLGVEIDNGFRPTYEIVKGREKTIALIKASAKVAKKVFLATDPDREGEAISWHISEAAGLQKSGKVSRVVFHEITKSAIEEAFAATRGIDMNLVDAQQARRILDRIVGYGVSPVLWRKLRKGLSAGRVQSVAARLIVEREEAIRKFTPTHYWHVSAILKDGDSNFQAFYKPPKNDAKGNSAYAILDEKVAIQVESDLKQAEFRVAGVEKEELRRFSPPPFTTSTLQQDASRRLRLGGQHTMRVAQSLYEGVELGKSGATGLITYMRTDSVVMAKSALFEARDFIKSNYGPEYTSGPRRHKTKSRNAQEAHEAIRPTSIKRTPTSITAHLTDEQFKLYELIWRRAVASQMTAAVFDETTITVEALTKTTKPSTHELESKGSVLKFDGWHKAYPEHTEHQTHTELPSVAVGAVLELDDGKVERLAKQTLPPVRYSEANLIHTLENQGIGRPSTYATIIGTLEKRDYARREKGRFKPTTLGEVVVGFLRDNFPAFMDIKFTAAMEEKLDEVAQGSSDWGKMLKEFHDELSSEITKAADVERVPSEKLNEVSDKHCPKCERPMLIKNGRFGTFLACSGFPECKSTMPITTGIKCPRCNKGELFRRRNKNGKYFHGCSSYPDCKFLTNTTPLAKPACPECGGIIGKRFFKGGAADCLDEKCGWKGAIPRSK